MSDTALYKDAGFAKCFGEVRSVRCCRCPFFSTPYGAVVAEQRLIAPNALPRTYPIRSALARFVGWRPKRLQENSREIAKTHYPSRSFFWHARFNCVYQFIRLPVLGISLMAR
jgi:hypothetical protein